MTVQLGFKAKDIIAEGRLTSDDITQVKVWLGKQENLPLISDEEIVNFLLSNDNDQEGTKNTIKAFFTIRNEAPDIFNNRIMTEENSEAIKSAAYFGMAPKRTKENCAVILAQFYNTRYQSFDIARFYKFLLMALDAAIYSSPPSGFIFVIDMVGFGLMHLTKLRVGAISVFFRYLQEALPVKLKNIHIINTPFFVDKILVIIKPFMSEHIRNLMIFHKSDCSMDEFYEKYVAKDLLPEDFGGELPCMMDLTEQLIQNLKNLEPYFIAEENQRSLLE